MFARGLTCLGRHISETVSRDDELGVLIRLILMMMMT